MKRFFKEASARHEVDGYAVLLDGRTLRTPARNALVTPSARLSEAIAAEWQAQGDQIDPVTMPLTRLANVVIDGVVPRAADLVESIAAYGGSDLICYWATHPDSLVERQARAWRPWLAWAKERYGAALEVTSGVMHRPQPESAVAALREAVAAHDPWHLGPLHMLTTASGSLVLALAVVEGKLPVDEAFALSEIDEAYQRERWGEDQEASERRSRVIADMRDAARFLDLLK